MSNKWDEMRDQLMGLSMKELKAIAKEEGICLGYAASRKDSTVGEIVTYRRNLELHGDAKAKVHPWRKSFKTGASRMTATERLRAMLDERGVEHFDGTETTLWGYEPTGESMGAYRFAADETSGGRMQVRMFNLTPEQAIEATLGRGTCRNISPRADWKDNEEFTCSECGFDGTYELGVPNYCPQCGKAVRA